MRPIRNFFINLRRKLQRPPQPPKPPARRKPGPPRIDFSYTIYWTKTARLWDAARRAEAAQAVAAILAQPGFEANDYQRRYPVPGLDDQAHAGASLVALRKVLAAFEAEAGQAAQAD